MHQSRSQVVTFFGMCGGNRTDEKRPIDLSKVGIGQSVCQRKLAFVVSAFRKSVPQCPLDHRLGQPSQVVDVPWHRQPVARLKRGYGILHRPSLPLRGKLLQGDCRDEEQGEKSARE